MKNADFFRDPNSWPPTMQLRSLDTGQVINEFVFPPGCSIGNRPRSIRFASGGQQVIFVGGDDVAYCVDKTSGKIIRKVDPRKWVWVITLVIGTLVFVWCLWWFQICNEIGLGRPIRSALLTLLLLIFLALRLAYSGNHENTSRFAWQAMIALGLVWGMSLTFYSAQYNSWWKRLRLPLWYVSVIYFILVSQEFDRYDQSVIVRVTLGYCGLLAPVILWGRSTRSTSSDESRGRQFSLAWGFEVLGLTTLLIAAIVKTNPGVWHFMAWGKIAGTALMCTYMLSVAIAAWNIVHWSKCHLCFRILALALVAVTAGCLHLAWTVYVSTNDWVDRWEVLVAVWPVAATAIFVAIGFWPEHSERVPPRNQQTPK